MTNKFAFLATCLASVAGCAASIYYVGHANGLPFTPQFTGADTALVRAIPGVPLPQGLKAGDEIDLPALDSAARAVLVVGGQANANLRLGDSYTFQIRDGAADRAVPVTTVTVGEATPQRRFIGWVFVYTPILLALMGIIGGWRGIGRAASFFSLWCACVLFPLSLLEVPLAPGVLLYAYFISFVGVFLGRLTMYALAETVAGDALSPRERTWLRAVFGLTLALGILIQFAGETVFLIQGSAIWILPGLRWLVAFPHLISALVLALAMRRAHGADRIRLTWMAWSVLFVFLGTLIRDVGIFDAVVTLGADVGFVSLGVIGMLYAILRHRVIDMSVVVDRTLVYGATTSLVVGVIAAMNSLALKATLGEGTGLLLQIVVPLALGIVLGKLRAYMDRIVERVFFRQRYLTEQALRAFGRHAGHFDDVQELLAAAVANLARHTGSPGIAMYEPSKEGYTSMRASGTVKFPKKLRTDDPAMVAVRAEMRPFEVSYPDSALSRDAVVFPITVLGRLRGVVVCANRPGEHFSSDEQKLIAEVVREVGAAWRILRAGDNEALVWALADGDIKPAAAQRRARLLAYGARA